MEFVGDQFGMGEGDMLLALLTFLESMFSKLRSVPIDSNSGSGAKL